MIIQKNIHPCSSVKVDYIYADKNPMFLLLQLTYTDPENSGFFLVSLWDAILVDK